MGSFSPKKVILDFKRVDFGRQGESDSLRGGERKK